MFWGDAFEKGSSGGRQLTADDISQIREDAERAMDHLGSTRPPLHANALAVMFLALRRVDAWARNLQIATEARAYYDDARANADGKHEDIVERDLNVTKYLFWEERDMILELEPLVRHAWEYENRPSHELSVLERYHLAAQRAIERADRIDAVSQEYAARKTLPTFDEALGLGKP
jgi:hypothetical protein